MLVAVNRHVKNKMKTPEEFSQANGTYENLDLSLADFANEVSNGHPFCAQHSGGWRNKSNFMAAGFLAVDIDHGLRIETALAHEFVRQFGGFLYTTPSHTDEDHRFRIVFELDEPITDRKRMESALTGLISKFGGDRTCKDACRQFFGNTTAVVTMIGKRLLLAELDKLATRGAELIGTAGGAEKNSGNRDTIRSTIVLDANVVVIDRSGHSHRLADLPPLTSVHCPQHVDDHPSAFTIRSRKGTPGVHCSSCASTYYIQHEGPYYDFDYGLRVLQDKSLEEWELELEQENDPYFEPEVKKKASGVHIVTENFLQPIETNASVIFVKSQKGSGKTEWLTKIVADAKLDKLSVLLIGHRRSLILSTAKRLGLTAYIQIVEDPDTGRSSVEAVHATRNYAVCVDSLDSRLVPAKNQYDIVIIDEVEQVIAHLTSSTLREHRRETLAHLSYYLKRSKKLYALDADLHSVSVNCIKSMVGNRQDCLFLFNDRVDKRGPLNLYGSKDQLAQRLHDDLVLGRRCFVCANSKEIVDRLMLTLQERFGEQKKFNLITSDNSHSKEVQDLLLNLPDSFLEYDCVLVSPAVGTGVDITFPNAETKIDAVFGFFQARVTTHFDMDQQLSRVRHPGAVHVWISPQTFSFETDSKVLRREVLDATRREIGPLGFDDNGIPQYHPIDDLYAEIYSEVKSLQRASKNNLRENFRALRTHYGWDVIDVPPSKDAKEAGQALMDRGEELQQERFIAQVCSAPAISSEEYADLRVKEEKETMLTVEVAAMRRHEIEQFYLCPVSPELLALDKHGRYRHAVRLFDLVTGTEQEARTTYHVKADMAVDRSELVDRRRVLIAVFTSAGIFSAGEGFDGRAVITHEGLTEFVQTVRSLSASIQRLLDRTPRQDIEQKPAQQLGDFLRLVGLSLRKVGQKRRGDLKIYSYQINDNELSAIQAIAANRRNSSTRRDPSLNQREYAPSRSTELQEAIANAAEEFRSKLKRPKKQKEMIDGLLGDDGEPVKLQAGPHDEAEAATSA